MLPKPALHGGIGHNHSIVRFDLNNAIEYFTNTEQVAGTDKVTNTVQYATGTPYGFIGGELDLIRSITTAIGDGELISVSAEAIHGVEFFQIPIGVQYTLFENSEWRIGIKGGLALGILGRNGFAINDIAIERDGFTADDTRFTQLPRPNQTTALQIQSGLSIAYKISDQWALSLEPTGNTSITNNHTGNVGQTRRRTMGMQAGLNYSF